MSGVKKEQVSHILRIPCGGAVIEGDLEIPEASAGVVIFAHGSGSSRYSPRNQYVAGIIRESGVATLLMDLLTRDEERIDDVTRRLRFDIGLLASRLVDAARWISSLDATRGMRTGFFGASTGGGAALVAAAELGGKIGAVVSRGGRPDLAGESLPLVTSPTLLIVGGRDEQVIELNRQAYARLGCKKELKIVPGATHLFEEPGALEEVARLAAAWFKQHLQAERDITAAGGGQ